MHLPCATESSKTSQRYVLSLIYNCAFSPCTVCSVVVLPDVADSSAPSRLFLRRNSDLIFFVPQRQKLLRRLKNLHWLMCSNAWFPCEQPSSFTANITKPVWSLNTPAWRIRRSQR